MCEHKPVPHVLYSMVWTTNLKLWVGKHINVHCFCLVRVHSECTSICLKAFFGRIFCKEPKQCLCPEDRALYITIK